MLEDIRKIVKDLIRVDVTDNESLLRYMDSMTHLKMLLLIEQKYHIKIEDDDNRFTTINESVSTLNEYLQISKSN